MKAFRYIFIIFVLFSCLQANTYNIIVASRKHIPKSVKRIFFRRFHNGILEKQKNYYVLKLKGFKGYKSAKRELKKVKKYYKDAFIVKDTSSKKGIKKTKRDRTKKRVSKKAYYHHKKIAKHHKSKKSFIRKRVSQSAPNHPGKLAKIDLTKKRRHTPVADTKISTTNNRPKINEPKVLESFQIPSPYKTTDTNKYDILNLSKYIKALFNYHDSAKEAFYQKKIEYILSEIKKDRYGFDVYVDGYLRTGTSISTNANNIQGNGKYTNAGIALNANKLLYDGKYWLTKHTYDILYKRLAQIREINAKEILSLLGVSIYTDMYAAQERRDMYVKMLSKQAKIERDIAEGFKKGINSMLDYISAKNDYINIQRSLLDAKYNYLYSDYVLRHSIKSKSKKPYKLYPVKIKLNTSSLKTLQKEALRQSSEVAMQSNLLKLKETDLKWDENRYYPTINFNSNIGYGLNRDNTFDLSNSGKGVFWSLGLTFRMPIYERGDITLSKEKDRYSILKQKSVFSRKQRDILTKIEKSYNEIDRIKKQKFFLTELLKLSLKKYRILTERYKNGISPYKDYSDALNNYLTYKDQLINMQQNYIKEVSLLSVLIGKKKFYEQN